MTENVIAHLKLKRRSDLHMARKIWHMTGVFFMFAFWRLAPEWLSYQVLTVAWLIFVPADVIRQRSPALNDFLVHAFRPILRAGEESRLAGTSYLITGVVIIVLFFPRSVVDLTLLFLAFADPIASIVGIKFGKDKVFGHKSIQGFMAAYFVCFLCSMIYVLIQGFPIDRGFVFCLLAGLIGALAELIPLWKLDDNLTLPVLSSIGLFILFYLFGFLS